MSDRYHGSAFRSRGPRHDDRRYAPRHHHRDEHGYADARPYDARDPYPPSTYYSEPRGYPDHRPRRVHRTIPPPRPWDYSRRPPPRNEQERMDLEREREAWEAKEEERYQQRMEEREREREAERGHGGPAHHSGWDYDAEERGYRAGPEAHDRDRPRHADHGPLAPRRLRSRSPGLDPRDPRYEQRGSWTRASIGSSDGRERELERSVGVPPAERAEPSGSYHPRRSPPPAALLDTPEAPRSRSGLEITGSPPRGLPRGPPPRAAGEGSGFISTPPTGPRASRGPPMASPAFRGREGSGSNGLYTPGSDRDREVNSYLSPSNGRYGRPPREGPVPAGAYRGGHPSFGRGRRDTNPYEAGYAGAEDDGHRGYGGHAGSSPHEASPYSPSTSTPGGAHLAAPRLSRTSSSQTPTTPATVIPTGPSASTNSPSTATYPSVSTASHFSSAYKLCPDLDAELQTLEAQRNAFISNHVLGAKRTAIRTSRAELMDAELDYITAGSRRQAAEKALEVARETADAYSLEENRKEELQRLIAQQLQQSQSQLQSRVQAV